MGKTREGYTKTNVEINSTHLERFKEIFPMRGSISWFINACIEEVVGSHDEVMKDVISDVVGEVDNG
jgi:hypothetical protein